jgi:hypothetical protein
MRKSVTQSRQAAKKTRMKCQARIFNAFIQKDPLRPLRLGVRRRCGICFRYALCAMLYAFLSFLS